MFGWLLRKAQQRSLISQEREIILFIRSLQGMHKDELASLLVMATRQRLIIEGTGVQLTAALDGFSPPDEGVYPLKIGGMIRGLQKAGDMAAAGSMMIWAHSIRAAINPALRVFGRQLWAELDRGRVKIPEAFVGLRQAGLPLTQPMYEQCEYVPALFDPSRH